MAGTFRALLLEIAGRDSFQTALLRIPGGFFISHTERDGIFLFLILTGEVSGDYLYKCVWWGYVSVMSFSDFLHVWLGFRRRGSSL